MSRIQDHSMHAVDKARRNRLRIAQEAARLMSEHGIRDFHHAKLKAAGRLGIADTQSLPRNAEIELALRAHQRLFLADSQPQWLRQRREAAVEAMTAEFSRLAKREEIGVGAAPPRSQPDRSLGGRPLSKGRAGRRTRDHGGGRTPWRSSRTAPASTGRRPTG